MPVHLFFLGVPHFQSDGHHVSLTPAKAVALLAYLSATARPQPHNSLLGLFWAESAEEAARRYRNALWTIRRVLGNDTIVADGETLALGQNVQSDNADVDCTGREIDRQL